MNFKENPHLRYYARMGVLLILYLMAGLGSLWTAAALRFEFAIPESYWWLLWQYAGWVLPLTLVVLWLGGQFRSLLTYFSLPDTRRIALAILGIGGLSLGLWYYQHGEGMPPRSIILLHTIFTTIGLIGIRLLLRGLRTNLTMKPESIGQRRKYALIGAGDVGADLAREMKLKRGLRMLPVAFFDDDRQKWNTSIHGVPVFGAPEQILRLRQSLGIDEVIICLPTGSGRRIRQIVEFLAKAGLKAETMPTVQQLVTGQAKITQIRPVDVEDLLGRDAVKLNDSGILQLIQGQVVLVTGAGGSIGSELCRQIVRHHPRQLLLVERCEAQLFTIEQELARQGYGAEILPIVHDIADEASMRGLLQQHRPKVIFHAAAHKHVPLMEGQPAEAFQNNTMGTYRLAEWSNAAGVEKFIMISTDKAIRPANVMGVTKRMAELSLQALQERCTTQFMAVRFGNVLGSSGSVLPIFKKQIAEGGPVTVTHPEVTRYFMTIPEAVGLVLQAATLGQGRDIFILDMGEPIKILDVARQLIRLSGLVEGADIEIRFTGLRPGEKLFEELNLDHEKMTSTDHPKIRKISGETYPAVDWERQMLDLERDLHAYDVTHLKMKIRELVPEYTPYFTA